MMQLWVPPDTQSCGYIDVSAELIVMLAKQRKDNRPRDVVVIEDPLPDTASVRRIAPATGQPDTLRIELDGTEARQYCPMFEERFVCEPLPSQQITDHRRRAIAVKAMWELLYAMDMERKSRIVTRDERVLTLFFALGKTLLGDDCPEQMRG